MAFDPESLPSNVYKVYKLGVMAWMAVVEESIKAQITDPGKIASYVFYLHHPERNGKAIEPHELKEISEWKAFRRLIGVRLGSVETESAADRNPGRVKFNDITMIK